MKSQRAVFSTEFRVVASTTLSEEEYRRLVDSLSVPLEDVADEASREFQKKVSELDPRLRLVRYGTVLLD